MAEQEFKRSKNGLAEDLGAVIGFSNTLFLCAIRGGKTLYVPEAVSEDHWLAINIGASAFRAMVGEWGGETITVPALAEFTRYQRIRRTAELLSKGHGLHQIARLHSISYNQAKNDRRSAELLGLIRMVLAGMGSVKTTREVLEQKGFEF